MAIEGAVAPHHDMDNNRLPPHTDLVSWTLSGAREKGWPILVDAADTTRFISGTVACQLVEALGGAFTADSTVCLHLPNDVLYPVLVLGILSSGCRWTGTNPAYTVMELEHHFRISQTRYVITSPEHVPVVEAAVEVSGTLAEIIIFEDLLRSASSSNQARRVTSNSIQTPTSCHRTLRELLYPIVSSSGLLPKPRIDSIAALMQTSGTTGLPKLAARTQQSIMLELSAIEDNHASKPYEVRRLFCTPIFHAFSAPEMLFNSLRLGHPTYFMRRYDETFAQKVHNLRITEIFGAPPMLLKLVERPLEARHLLSSLKAVYFGGAPLGGDVRKKFLSVFETPPRLVPVYGMTEGGWFSTFSRLEDDPSGSVGRPLPGLEVKISTANTDMADSPIRHNNDEAGELLVRGPQIMSGYYNNPTATISAFTPDGWLKTGDIGYLRDGKIYLVDRAKDMIKVNAWQVSPTELESALLLHPLIADAAVYGTGQDVDERPVACVVRRPDAVTAPRREGGSYFDSGLECERKSGNGGMSTEGTLTKQEVRDYLRQRLAGYKVSRCEVVFVDSLPRNGAGKVLRKVLKEQVEGAVPAL
ncbi:hypothetical protein BAUCODRAFT_150128 [Baudoinia panamericana UAMH 10762]|uniref:AMP-dependent synthetase/ligase domain-containing protein n=1 Tax=Baudoinia panamericana (strain UAMH 10762) TaxID=717646 RepID=M2MQZ0_BAUPA|nr:uncharacterized protein BAUCODRAFT_150128 [Baudoinia panamericana UAMH 10762]EMC93893.1 hypothetical protein BAUCODRAFT_150128 [Baudoinia panamericana UAMH 10762]